MAEFPALPLWTDAYLADTSHLTDAQHGLYLRLLILIWRSPQCRVPNNDTWLMHKLSTEPELFRKIIAEFCKSDGNWITQKRLLKEWRWVRKKGKSNSAAAKARWEKEKDISVRNANAMPPHPHPHPHLINGKNKSKQFSNGDGVTVKDPQERLNRFQKAIADAMGRDGYSIVGAAANPDSPLYARSLALCKAKAKELGKGWPHQWPK